MGRSRFDAETGLVEDPPDLRRVTVDASGASSYARRPTRTRPAAIARHRCFMAFSWLILVPSRKGSPGCRWTLPAYLRSTGAALSHGLRHALGRARAPLVATHAIGHHAGELPCHLTGPGLIVRQSRSIHPNTME